MSGGSPTGNPVEGLTGNPVEGVTGGPDEDPVKGLISCPLGHDRSRFGSGLGA
ncbi:hypothetical protein ACFV0O_32140 [Kitasatospora sp. NPDC059577]|uniref:hypothetical protein n=1 Tax=unclassified Kitasatospora TaxID=2633591 RepID=UPI0036771982